MQDFSIITRLTTKEYFKIFLIGTYKKPGVIISMILGLYCVITVALNYLNIINYYSSTPYFEIICGIFILLGPLIITLLAASQFNANSLLKQDITYTFTNEGMSIEGKTFKSQLLWAHIIKQKEIGNFLILYHTKRLGNFIDKRKLTTDQIDFLKSKVGNK